VSEDTRRWDNLGAEDVLVISNHSPRLEYLNKNLKPEMTMSCSLLPTSKWINKERRKERYGRNGSDGLWRDTSEDEKLSLHAQYFCGLDVHVDDFCFIQGYKALYMLSAPLYPLLILLFPSSLQLPHSLAPFP
jgi:hypothetical protein